MLLFSKYLERSDGFIPFPKIFGNVRFTNALEIIPDASGVI